MDKSHRLPFPLSTDDCEAIGALAAHYSHAEWIAAAAVWKILRLEAYDGALITGPLSLAQRLETVIALLEHRHAVAAELQVIKNVATEFKKDEGITQRRNRYIHSVWAGGTEKTPATLTLNFSKQGRLRVGNHEAADLIEATTRDLTTQCKLLTSALRKLGFDPSTGVTFQVPKPASDA